MREVESPGDKLALTVAIALLSGAALAYEIVLMRLLSIIQWHHFAYMIISLALLGYGAGGLILAVLREWMNARFPKAFSASVILFGISAPFCFWLAQSLPFNPAEIFWDPLQALYLFVLYLLLAIPFFFAAMAIGLALYHYREQLSGIYAADLAGAGLGSVAVIGMLFLAPPERALMWLSVAPVIGLIPYCLCKPDLKLPGLAVCIGLPALLLIMPQDWQTLKISPYKEMAQWLRIPGVRIVDRFSSPIATVDVVESPEIPFRYAPGLSLNADVSLPRQLAVFNDSDNMTAVTEYNGRTDSLAYLDQMTSALTYHLFRPDDLLILGAGTGSDLLQARLFGVKKIDAVELNRQLLDYLSEQQNEFSGGLFSDPSIQFHIGEARGFVASSKQDFDVIQISLLDAFGAASAGLYALSENYLYTVEALQSYIEHLHPQGYLVLTRWVKMPPRDTLKLFATAVAALEKAGHRNPGQQLALIRGWQTSTLLVKNGEITSAEIDELKKFCNDRFFDADYYPGIQEQESNRYNILAESYYYHAARSLLSAQRNDYIDNYKFDIRPATDDRPYFFKFFKWSSLPEIVSLFHNGGIALLEGGYVILIAGVVQALLASALFIGLPLWIQKKKPAGSSLAFSRLRWPTFFFCLGLAFLFVEIAFMQKFILFLHHPVYALATVLSTFLLSAGAGSYFSHSVNTSRLGHWYPIIGIAVLAIVYLCILKDLTTFLLHQPAWFNFVVSILLTAPLGFFMGMPFPLGLMRIGQSNPEFIPWAWGINGLASVISTMLATLIAIHSGFNTLILLAVGLYLVAGWCLPNTVSANSEQSDQDHSTRRRTFEVAKDASR